MYICYLLFSSVLRVVLSVAIVLYYQPFSLLFDINLVRRLYPTVYNSICRVLLSRLFVLGLHKQAVTSDLPPPIAHDTVGYSSSLTKFKIIVYLVNSAFFVCSKHSGNH